MNQNPSHLPDLPFARSSDGQFAQRLAGLAVVFALAGCVALSIDFLAGWVFLGEAGPTWAVLRKGLRRLVDPAESFANGLGIILILLTLFAVDVTHRRGLLRWTVVIFGAGFCVNAVKGLVARTRPKILFDIEADGFAGNVFNSFTGWLPLASLGYPGQSFPSGHTATAVALAIVLCRRWPRGRWAFILLAALAGLQRVVFGDHYPSDCLLGAAIACGFAAVCYHPNLAGRWFNRFEGNANHLQPGADDEMETGAARNAA